MRRLETDIQNLEQHLEAMRATYQLNTEKLEYNYRVLVERDHENQVCVYMYTLHLYRVCHVCGEGEESLQCNHTYSMDL